MTTRTIAIALALGVTLAVTTAATAQTTLPPDFTIPRGEGSPGEVIFSHARHMTQVQKCTRCHMRDFKMKRGASGPITLEAKQGGRFCGACHDAKTPAADGLAFPLDECDRCHK